MRRISVSAILIVVLGVLVAAGWAPFGMAQEGTPGPGSVPMAGHPLVGTWIVDDPNGVPAVTAFTADGVVTDQEATGGTGLGTWRPTGDRTAVFTFIIVVADPQFAATIQIDGTADIDESGAAGTGAYVYTVVLPDGTVPETGRGTLTFARLPIRSPEAAGTPIPQFPTWAPQGAEGGATPEGTPGA